METRRVAQEDAPELCRKIVERAAAMLAAFEQEGAKAAQSEWDALNRLVAGRGDALPDPVANLLTEASIFAEECPAGDASELRHAIYSAKAFLSGKSVE